MDDRGSLIIEFAMVTPMLFVLLLTIVDLGFMLLTQSVLDGAARDAARLIRTGQVQTSGSPISTFQNLLCSDLSSVMSTGTCTSSVIFDVQVFSNYSSVAFPACTLNNNQTGAGTVCNFSAGTGTQIVGVQVTYNYPFMVPWVGSCLSGGTCWLGMATANGSSAGTGTAPLISTVVFQNEPFPSS
jgi:Flp pilus assembly protein TadG